MAMGPFHRFARRQLWRLAGLLAALVVVGLALGGAAVVRIVEWLPMSAAVLLLGLHLAPGVRARVHARARRRG